MTLNYIGLIMWVFVWMIDQAHIRGKTFWVWLVPFILTPLPTLMLFVLFLQRRIPLTAVIDQPVGTAAFADGSSHQLYGLSCICVIASTILVFGTTHFFVIS
jgi:hypothetical protein